MGCFRVSEQLRLGERQLPGYLVRRGIVADAAGMAVERAGDGNINWVRRARAADGRSWIVKQARPALERFPEYHASTERIVFEHRYHERASKLPEGEICPKIVDFDECERVLVMEDLGGAERLDEALARGADVSAPVAALGRFLGAVHGSTREPGLAERFRNHEMQRLHGDHIFELPLRQNDFPLPPALRVAADRLREDAGIRTVADRLYARYLEPRGALVHGDVQAGNVLLAGQEGSLPKLLDAEIAHVGDPAFDVGILVAHLWLPTLAQGGPGEPAAALVASAWTAYCHRLDGALDVPFSQVARYAGVEMLRRTIGAARIDAAATPEVGLRILERACAWLREPPTEPG